MNGVDAVVIATGNDWRAVEAGAHAYAARERQVYLAEHLGQRCGGQSGRNAGDAHGSGHCGGATRVHPTAKAALKLMGVQSAAASWQKLLFRWVWRRIWRRCGHWRLRDSTRSYGPACPSGGHCRRGAGRNGCNSLADQMVAERNVRIDRAEEILREWSNSYIDGNHFLELIEGPTARLG